MITHVELAGLISREAFRNWQRRLIYEEKLHKSSGEPERAEIRANTKARQQALADAIEAGPSAVRDFICGMADLRAAKAMLAQLPALPRPLTEAEMTNLPSQAASEVAAALDDWGISPMLAGESSFWALCHARWIGDEMFPDGVWQVFASGGRAADDPEAMTRNFLRNIGGLHPVRGNTSVITDCELSGAWWRCRLARDIAETLAHEGEALNVSAVYRVLQGGAWEHLVGNMVKRLASVNAPRARAAVVLAMHEEGLRNNGRAVPREAITACMQKVAQLGETFSLNLVAWDQLLAAAREGITGP